MNKFVFLDMSYRGKVECHKTENALRDSTKSTGRMLPKEEIILSPPY